MVSVVTDWAGWAWATVRQLLGFCFFFFFFFFSFFSFLFFFFSWRFCFFHALAGGG